MSATETLTVGVSLTAGSFFSSPSENFQPIFNFKMCILQHYLTFQVLTYCKSGCLQGVHFEPKYCVLFSCRYHGSSLTSHSENFTTTLEKLLGLNFFLTKLHSLNKVFFYYSLLKLIIFACYSQIWISVDSNLQILNYSWRLPVLWVWRFVSLSVTFCFYSIWDLVFSWISPLWPWFPCISRLLNLMGTRYKFSQVLSSNLSCFFIEFKLACF